MSLREELRAVRVLGGLAVALSITVVLAAPRALQVGLAVVILGGCVWLALAALLSRGARSRRRDGPRS